MDEIGFKVTSVKWMEIRQDMEGECLLWRETASGWNIQSRLKNHRYVGRGRVVEISL